MDKQGFERILQKEILKVKEGIINQVQGEQVSSLSKMKSMFKDIKNDLGIVNEGEDDDCEDNLNNPQIALGYLTNQF